jgi:hypothetical protein
MKHRSTIALALALVLPACASTTTTTTPAGPVAPPPAPAAPTQPVTGNLPLKFTGGPTVPAITASDLMTRVYIFADDSMGGRQVGTEYNLKGAAYIERELRRLGVQPAGENGTYFQDVPVGSRNFATTSTLTVDGKTFQGGKDFLATGTTPAGTSTLQVLYAGQALDTMNVPTAASLAGKIVMLRQAPPFTSQAQIQSFIASDGYKRYQEAFANVAGFITVAATDSLAPNSIRQATASTGTALLSGKPQVSMLVTPAVAAAVLGKPVASATKGTAGKAVTVNLSFNETRKPARNVIGLIPGSDPALRGQYVVFGAHNDHVGFTTPVEHDSLRAFNTVLRKGGVEDQPPPPSQITPEQWARVNAIKDSLRALHGGIRMDSINNGADDDGSGSMALLEIAESFARNNPKPKRSLLFVWHTGEEMGMWGSGYFVDHPTVPRDSIVGALNVDMIGRGGPDDIENGGPGYVQLLGSRRLSTEMGDLVEAVNRDKNAGFTFDYQFDANGHPQQYYCRSDHWSYARWNIPVTFFSTGGHRDYHMRTDEPQYINYPHYEDVTQFIHDVGERIANLDHRLVVDGAKGDPNRPCVQ